MTMLLVGAGGHGRVVVEIATRLGLRLAAYVDRNAADWLDVPRYADEPQALSAYPEAGLALGMGGVTPQALKRRLSLFSASWSAGRDWPALIHPDASVTADAVAGKGTQVMAMARFQPGARVGRGVIVNTGAIIEHGAVLGDGCHIAPGAIVLGDCVIGSCAMIGAGAVVLPGARVPDGALVKAGERFPR